MVKQLYFLFAVALLTGCFGGQNTATPAGVSQEHAKMIRNYLKSNTPTGNWEEIEWSANPATTMGFNEQKQWVELADGNDISLKYRTQNPLGGMSIQSITLREDAKGEFFRQRNNGGFVSWTR